MAARWPPWSEPANSQYLRPTAIPRSAFGGIVVDLEPAIIDVAGERRPTCQGIADGDREVGPARQLGQGRVEPVAQSREGGSGACLSFAFSFVRQEAAHIVFKGSG